jgi:hypothetical protein
MTPSGVISIAVMSVFFSVCGSLCIFKTKMLVAWGQKSYAKNTFVRNYPLSSMVTKKWYPVYIRCA